MKVMTNHPIPFLFLVNLKLLKIHRFGVLVDKYDFATINIIAEMEKSRQMLNVKAMAYIHNCEAKEEVDSKSINLINEGLDYISNINDGMEEVTFETYCFIVVPPKRERKTPRRLTLSGK
jgi:hypothetical protein